MQINVIYSLKQLEYAPTRDSCLEVLIASFSTLQGIEAQPISEEE
jgi:hypothetical protein